MDNYIITPRLGGLAAYDQSKTKNPIQNSHKHTNKAGTMITICPHGVVPGSQLSKSSRFSQIRKKIKVNKRLFFSQSLNTYI